MKIKIPCAELIKSVDDVTELSHKFLVDCIKEPNAIIIEADEDAILDFMTAYHDVDMDEAAKSIEKYRINEIVNRKKFYTPEAALQKINEYVLAKGGFEDYDEIFEVLNNAINGMI